MAATSGKANGGNTLFSSELYFSLLFFCCISQYFLICYCIFFSFQPLWMLDPKDISNEEHEVCKKKIIVFLDYITQR